MTVSGWTAASPTRVPTVARARSSPAAPTHARVRLAGKAQTARTTLMSAPTLLPPRRWSATTRASASTHWAPTSATAPRASLDATARLPTSPAHPHPALTKAPAARPPTSTTSVTACQVRGERETGREKGNWQRNLEGEKREEVKHVKEK